MVLSLLLLALGSAVLTLRLGGDLGSFPRTLSAEEEKHYIDRLTKGDLEARNKLIEHNLRLVAHIIKKYYTQSTDQNDLISIGTIGLIKGISTYKPERGVRLATYASRCVENAILTRRKQMISFESMFVGSHVTQEITSIIRRPRIYISFCTEEINMSCLPVPSDLSNDGADRSALFLYAHFVDDASKRSQKMFHDIKAVIRQRMSFGQCF